MSAEATLEERLNLEAQPQPGADLMALYRESRIGEVLAELDRDLIGLAPVKTRIREIAAHLLVERARETLGIASGAPTLHMCFGNPGTGRRPLPCAWRRSCTDSVISAAITWFR